MDEDSHGASIPSAGNGRGLISILTEHGRYLTFSFRWLAGKISSYPPAMEYKKLSGIRLEQSSRRRWILLDSLKLESVMRHLILIHLALGKVLEA